MKTKKNRVTSKCKPKQKQKRKRTISQLGPPAHSRKYSTHLKIAFGATTFLLAIVGFLFLMYPKISIEPGSPLYAYDPFSCPFTIKNDGNWQLCDIRYRLELEKVTASTMTIRNCAIFFSPQDAIPQLDPNDSSTILIDRLKIQIAPIDYAEIYIALTYRLKFVPQTFKEHRRFIVSKNSNGEYFWRKYYSKK